MKHFLSLKDWTPRQLRQLLELSHEIKRNPKRYSAALHGRNIALLFMKPSTRTRISFEVGINQLGGKVVVLSGSGLQVGRGETVSDTIKVMSRYLDGVMARVFEHDMLLQMAEHGSIPIINGLSDLLHPCQGLCDLYTIREHFGSLDGRRITYLGDGNNVAHSLLYGGAKLGVHVTIATPEGYEVDPTVLAEAQEMASASGAELVMTHDPAAAVKGAEVLYTDVWASMGQEAEQAARKKIFAPYQINAALMGAANPNAIFMHCLPAHRGEEVSADVMDSERSVVFDQAENRLHTQKALMCLLFQ